MKLFIIDTNDLNLNNIILNNNYYFKKDKLIHHCSILIKDYLLSYLNFNKNDFFLEKNIYGKPFFKSKESDLIINFNVSHDETRVILFYFDNQKVGIDIIFQKERSKLFFNGLVNNFTIKESNLLKKSINFILDFYKIWCFKEAYLKYLGIGIDTNKIKKIDYTEFKHITCNKIFINNKDFKLIGFKKKNNIQIIELESDNYIIALCFSSNENINNHLDVIKINL